MTDVSQAQGYGDFGRWLRNPGSVLRFADTREFYRAAARGMHRRLLMLGLLGFVLALAQVLPAVTLRPLVQGADAVHLAEVVPFLLTMVGVGLLDSVQHQLVGSVVAVGTRGLSLRAFDALLRAPAEWYGVLPLGSSVKVTVEDAPEAASGLALIYELAFASARLAALILGIVVLLPTATGLTAAAVVVAGLLLALRLQRGVMSRQRQAYVASLELAEYVGERCQETTLAEIRVAGTASHELAGLGQHLDRQVALLLSGRRWSAGRTAAIHGGAAAGAAVVAVMSVDRGDSAGTLLVGLVLALSLTQVAPGWFEARERLIASATAMTRMLALEKGLPAADASEVGDGAPSVRTLAEAGTAPSAPADVRLCGVSFSYPDTSSLPVFLRFNKVGAGDPRTEVLHEVSLDVEPGQLVALVGPSGAGKSTIARLIAGLYAPSAGEVLVDGRPPASPGTGPPLVALVPDRPWLIDASIVDNVRYGYPAASLDEVHAACRQASVLDFVQSLPAGLNTPVGVNGSKLSAGERQRLALARALLRRPLVLLLDEATALLDADSESAIRRAVTEDLSAMTRIVIAHRMSTVQDADHIFVIAAGRVVQQGTHEELRNESELYARWIKLQAV
jgi:ATP-binding cassette subfamily B protein